MRRRIERDGEADDPDEEDRRDRDDHGQQQLVADDLGDRQAVFEAVAHVAVQQPADPGQVLHDEGLVEPVFGADGGDARGIDRRALAAQLLDIGGEIVARAAPG